MTSAMVCMNMNHNNKNGSRVNHSFCGEASCYQVEQEQDDRKKEMWKFDWDSKTQGWVVSSFFAGYYVMQVPSGVIVTRFGPKISLVFGLLITGILHLLCVPAVLWSMPMLYTLRTLSGLACGCMVPGIYALIANWCPKQETSFLFGISNLGIDVGNSLSFLLALGACRIDFQGGWPIIFYALGTIQILMAITLMVCVTDFPSTHRFIDPSESKFISDNRAHNKKARSIPVRRILLSGPVWAFVAAQFALETMSYTFFTQVPLFIRDVIKLPHWETESLNSVPFVFTIPAVLITSRISDRVAQSKHASRTTVRKFNQTLGTILLSTPLLLIGFLPQGSFHLALILYIVWSIGMAGPYSGYLPNPGDISPAHAGFVASVGQVMTMWVAFAIPIFTGHLTAERDRHSWHIVFYIVIGLQVFACIFYLVFSSSELQPWALEEIDEETPIVRKQHGNHNKK